MFKTVHYYYCLSLCGHKTADEKLMLVSVLLSVESTKYKRGQILGSAPPCGSGVCVLCTRIDPLRFLAGCRRRRLNQGLVVALGFFSRC